jgi:hypothetical protein
MGFQRPQWMQPQTGERSVQSVSGIDPLALAVAVPPAGKGAGEIIDYLGQSTEEGVKGQALFEGQLGISHEDLGYRGLNWRFDPRGSNTAYWWGKPSEVDKSNLEAWLEKRGHTVESHENLLAPPPPATAWWEKEYQKARRIYRKEKGLPPEEYQQGGVATSPGEWYHRFVQQGLLEPGPYSVPHRVPEQEHDMTPEEIQAWYDENARRLEKLQSGGGYQKGGVVMPDYNYYPMGDGQYGVFDRNWKRIGTMPGRTFQEGGVSRTQEVITPTERELPYLPNPNREPVYIPHVLSPAGPIIVPAPPAFMLLPRPRPSGLATDDPAFRSQFPKSYSLQTGGVAHEPNGEREPEGEKEKRKLRGIVSKYAFQTGGVTGDPTLEHQPPNIFQGQGRSPEPLPSPLPPGPVPRPPMPPTGYPPPMPTRSQMPPGYSQYPMMQTGGTVDENGSPLPDDFIPTPTPGPAMPAVVHHGEVILTPEQAAHVSIDPAFRRLFKPEQLAAMGAFEATEAAGFQTGGRARASRGGGKQEAVGRHAFDPETGEPGGYGYFEVGDQPFGAAPPWTRGVLGNPYLGGYSPGGPAWYSPGGIPVYLNPQGVPYGIPTWVNPTDPSTIGTAHYGPGQEDFQEGGVPSYRTGGSGERPGGVEVRGGGPQFGGNIPRIGGIDIPPADMSLSGDFSPRDYDIRTSNYWSSSNPWLNMYLAGNTPGTYNWNYNPNLPGQTPGTNFPTYFDPQGYALPIPVLPSQYDPLASMGGRHAFPYRSSE